MKRCPECRRDYYDDSLLYCLDDGAALFQSSVPSPDEPATAILHETAPASERRTSSQLQVTDQTAILPSGVGHVVEKSFDKRLALIPLALAVVVVSGIFFYRNFAAPKQIESIAVMPFVNDSGDPDLEYLSDGMTETLISSLTQLPNLNVKAFRRL